MSREIKFRFYDKLLLKMIYRELLPYDNEHPNIEVMQFTGRRDVNGVEVYEGDVIENCNTKELQTVYWNNEKSAWYCKYNDDNRYIVSLSDSIDNLNEVVGNIFEK